MILATSSPSCRIFHRAGKNTLPPAPPAPVSEPAQPPSPPAPVAAPEGQQSVALPSPPRLPPQEPALKQPAQSSPRAGTLPPPPARKRRSRPAETASAPPAQPAGQAQEPSTAPPIPQLERMLSPEQQQAFNDEIDRNIDRAQRTVAVLLTRRLNQEQSTYLERIRTFVQQAGDARKSDLYRARNLAERASVLAEDLLKSVQ